MPLNPLSLTEAQPERVSLHALMPELAVNKCAEAWSPRALDQWHGWSWNNWENADASW